MIILCKSAKKIKESKRYFFQKTLPIFVVSNFKHKMRSFFISVFILFAATCMGQQQNTPPQVIITDPLNGSVVYGEQVKITYEVSASAPKSVKISLDGKSVQLITDAKMGENSAMVDIPEKNCAITIVAQNEFGASVPATVELKRSMHIFKPSLYVLAIGVSNYDQPDLHLQFPAKDASDFAQALMRQAGQLYESVDVKLLTDRRATADNIREGLYWLQTQTTNRDIAMMFIAGHGINNNTGDFFFVPVNGDIEKINATCVSYTDIKSTINAIAGKLLVFMDACHSGNVMGTQQRAAAVSQAVADLTSADNGPVVFTSSTGRQYSLESSDWNNGAFTKALVEGLTGAADLSDTKTITVKSLDYYIANRVKELTGGKQAPTTIIPNSVPDFPIAVVTEITVSVKIEQKTQYASEASVSAAAADMAPIRKSSEMLIGITAGVSTFGDVSFANVSGGLSSVIGVDAIWFMNNNLGLGVKANMQSGKIEFDGISCNDRLMFVGPALYFRMTNQKRVAFTVGAGAGALNWNWRFSWWESAVKDKTATSVGGFLSAGINFMATQHIGFGINVQSLVGKATVDEYTRNPMGIGATAGVNFRF